MASLATSPWLLGRAGDVESAEHVRGEDERLMEAFRDGESSALATLFDRHAARIERMVLRLTGDRALARDLTQTTFLSVARGRARYVDGCCFRPWLATIAMNALRDQLRRTRRETLLPASAAVFENVGQEDQHRDTWLVQRLEAALHRLPVEQRQAVVLHHLEGFSFPEIAEIAGCSRAAAKVRAHRGYLRLRELLGAVNKEDV
jgi:RNA polymerase sigma-70 factor (ECF subfamily)